MNYQNSPPRYVILNDRGLLAIEGAEARTFLQGVISNDIEKATAQQAIYAALLTAQGKYLHDFFIAELNGVLLVDCEDARRDDLFRRLSMYKLRAQATISDQSGEYVAVALFGDGIEEICELSEQPGMAKPFHHGVAYVDPRHSGMGIRAILPREDAEQIMQGLNITEGSKEDYDNLRLQLGLPDGSCDMIIEKSILLENGFDELHGVDWNKGCYIGQELTARTKHRGLIKKRLVPVVIQGPPPAPGTTIQWDGKEVGEMRSSIDGFGLALIRLEYLDKTTEADTTFSAGDASVTPQKPDWVDF